MLAALGLLCTPALIEAGGGIKLNSAIRVTNRSTNRLVVVVDGIASALQLGSDAAAHQPLSPLTLSAIQSEGGAYIEPGRSATFTVNPGTRLVVFAELSATGVALSFGTVSVSNIVRGETRLLTLPSAASPAAPGGGPAAPGS